MNIFINEIIGLFKYKTYKIFEYLLVLLFLSNIFPQQFQRTIQIFSDNTTYLITWLNKNNWSIRKLLIIYCILVSLSVFRLSLHKLKTWGTPEFLDDLDTGILYNINTGLTYILLILTNVFPSLIKAEDITYILQTLSGLIAFPFFIFILSFFVSQFSFLYQCIDENNKIAYGIYQK
jgi:hypothetical protein